MKELRKYIREILSEHLLLMEAKRFRLSEPINAQLKKFVFPYIQALEKIKKTNLPKPKTYENNEDFNPLEAIYIGSIMDHDIKSTIKYYADNITKDLRAFSTNSSDIDPETGYIIDYVVLNPKCYPACTYNVVYDTLYHETIHALDPSLYLIATAEKAEKRANVPYWKRIEEFNAFTGNILNRIIEAIRWAIDTKRPIEEMRNVLAEMLDVYSTSDFSKNTMGFYKINKKISDKMKFYISTGTRTKWNYKTLTDYYEMLFLIEKIKEASPENYKKFLGKLYSTIQEAKLMIDDYEKNTREN